MFRTLFKLTLMVTTLVSHAPYACENTKDINYLQGNLKVPQTMVAMDGGGIRGYITTKILKELETKLGTSINNKTDLFVGTSAGGMNALGLASDHTVDELISLYHSRGNKIFHQNVWRQFASGWGLLDEKYDTQSLTDEMRKFYVNSNAQESLLSTLSSADAMVTAVNIKTNQLHWFNSYAAKMAPQHADAALWFAARSTSAAPTYFEPTVLNGMALVDGGVVSNNPALDASLQIHAQFGKDVFENLKVISIGTGTFEKGIHASDADDMGILEWASPITSTMMQTTSNKNHHQMQQIFGKKKQYIRLQPTLKSDIQLDSVSAANFAEMDSVVAEYISNNPKEIDLAVRLLR